MLLKETTWRRHWRRSISPSLLALSTALIGSAAQAQVPYQASQLAHQLSQDATEARRQAEYVAPRGDTLALRAIEALARLERSALELDREIAWSRDISNEWLQLSQDVAVANQEAHRLDPYLNPGALLARVNADHTSLRWWIERGVGPGPQPGPWDPRPVPGPGGDSLWEIRDVAEQLEPAAERASWRISGEAQARWNDAWAAQAVRDAQSLVQQAEQLRQLARNTWGDQLALSNAIRAVDAAFYTLERSILNARLSSLVLQDFGVIRNLVQRLERAPLVRGGRPPLGPIPVRPRWP